jgi:hypothetical protein
MLTVVKAARHEDRQPSWEAVHAIIQKADIERMRATGERVRALQDERRDALEAEVQRRLSHDGDSSEYWKERAEKAQSLVRDIGDVLGVQVIDGKWAYGASVVTLDQLRASFGRYLVAEKQVDAALQHKLMQIRAVRDAATEAEKALKAVGVIR